MDIKTIAMCLDDFGQAKFAFVVQFLSLSHFSLLPVQTLKMELAPNVVKIDLNIIILLPIYDSLCNIETIQNYVMQGTLNISKLLTVSESCLKYGLLSQFITP
jgi:hypothetical protein